jgi:hypothetical protein
MNLRKHIRRLQERDDVSQSIVLVVGDMVASGVPECGRRIEDHSDVYNIDNVSLRKLIDGLRAKADNLEQELILLEK